MSATAPAGGTLPQVGVLTGQFEKDDVFLIEQMPDPGTAGLGALGAYPVHKRPLQFDQFGEQ